MVDIEHRLVSHGGRLRAQEIEVILKAEGFEKGVLKVLQLLADRINTIGQENRSIAEAIASLTDTLNMVTVVLKRHDLSIKDTDKLLNKVEGTHPDVEH